MKIGCFLHTKNILSIAIGTILLLVGCKSSKQYQEFADLGVNYTSALDSFLKCSDDVAIDANTERLLSTRRSIVSAVNPQQLPSPETSQPNTDIGKLSAVLKQESRQKTDADINRLAATDQLREQVKLLKSYFEVLKSLANTDDSVPETVGKQVTEIANGLNNVSKKLESNPIFPREDFRKALGTISKLIISEKINGALREELETRQDLLQKQLLVHKYMVQALIETTEVDLKTIMDLKYKRTIDDSYVDIKNSSFPESNTIDERRKLLGIEKLILDLKHSSSISDEFKKVLIEVASGNANSPRIDRISKNVQAHKDVFTKLCNYGNYERVRRNTRTFIATYDRLK